jgi:hypothetical protein
MFKRIKSGLTIDLNYAFNGGLVDSSVSYEVPWHCSHIISVTAQGVVVPLAVGTAVVKVKEVATGKKICHVVVKVMETLAYQTLSDTQDNTTPLTIQAYVVLPPSTSSSGSSGSGGSGSGSSGGGSSQPSMSVFSPVVPNDGSGLLQNSFGNLWTQTSTGKKIFGAGNFEENGAWRMFDSDSSTFYTPHPAVQQTSDYWVYGGFINETAKTLYSVDLYATATGDFPATQIRVEGSNNSQYGHDGDWTPLGDLINISWSHGGFQAIMPSTDLKFKAFRIACPFAQALRLAKAEFRGY